MKRVLFFLLAVSVTVNGALLARSEYFYEAAMVSQKQALEVIDSCVEWAPQP